MTPEFVNSLSTLIITVAASILLLVAASYVAIQVWKEWRVR